MRIHIDTPDHAERDQARLCEAINGGAIKVVRDI